jgi:hypothetical protein
VEEMKIQLMQEVEHIQLIGFRSHGIQNDDTINLRDPLSKTR